VGNLALPRVISSRRREASPGAGPLLRKGCPLKASKDRTPPRKLHEQVHVSPNKDRAIGCMPRVRECRPVTKRKNNTKGRDYKQEQFAIVYDVKETRERCSTA